MPFNPDPTQREINRHLLAEHFLREAIRKLPLEKAAAEECARHVKAHAEAKAAADAKYSEADCTCDDDPRTCVIPSHTRFFQHRHPQSLIRLESTKDLYYRPQKFQDAFRMVSPVVWLVRHGDPDFYVACSAVGVSPGFVRLLAGKALIGTGSRIHVSKTDFLLRRKKVLVETIGNINFCDYSGNDIKPTPEYISGAGTWIEFDTTNSGQSYLADQYLYAVKLFIETNKTKHLQDFQGQTIKTSNGNRFVLLTDPDAVRDLMNAKESEGVRFPELKQTYAGLAASEVNY